VEELKIKILKEIEKAVISGRKIGLTAADLERILGEKKTKIEKALHELKGGQILTESVFGRVKVYSPREMVDLYIKQKKGR
jgi:chromosome segregation and condensation protein ScpB